MRVAVLDAQGHIINLIAVESELDIVGFGFHNYKVIAETEGVDIWEPPADIIDRWQLKVSETIQEIAKLKGYDSIDSCAKYVGFPNEWQVECLALLEWNASVWRSFFTWSAAVLASGQSSEFTIPTAP